MKFSKLISLLLLSSSLIGCNHQTNKLMECTNYDGKLACYLNTSNERDVIKFANKLLERGYGDFIIQTDKGYIEFKCGELID